MQKVRGLDRLIRRADEASRATKKLVRDDLKDAAAPIRDEGERLLLELRPAPGVTARGLAIRVRKTGVVSVEQRLRKTTGLRSDWGATQMRRGLVPAVEAKEHEVETRMTHAVAKVITRLESGS